MRWNLARAVRGECTSNGARQLLDGHPYVGVQIAPPRQTVQSACPEARLMLAVLDHALNDIQHGARVDSDRARALVAEALAWIASDDLHWPFAFLNICDVLGLDAQAVRRQVRAGLPILPNLGHRRARANGGLGRMSQWRTAGRMERGK